MKIVFSNVLFSTLYHIFILFKQSETIFLMNNTDATQCQTLNHSPWLEKMQFA